jgi:hypothetical protein
MTNKVHSSHHVTTPAATTEVKKDAQKMLDQRMNSGINAAKMNAANSDVSLDRSFADKLHQSSEKFKQLSTLRNRKLDERRLSFGANNLRTSDTAAPPEHELEDANSKMYGNQKNSLPKLKQALRRGMRQNVGQATAQEERTDENLKKDLDNADDSKVSKINTADKSNISDSQLDKDLDKVLNQLTVAMGAKPNDPTAKFLLLANQEDELDPKQDAKLIACIKRNRTKLINEHGDKIMAKYNSQDAQAELRHNGKYAQIAQFDELHYDLTSNPSIMGVFGSLFACAKMQKADGQPFSVSDWRKHVSLSKKTTASNNDGQDNFKNLKFGEGKVIYKTSRVRSHQQIDLSTGMEQNTLSHQNIVAQIYSYGQDCNKLRKNANAQTGQAGQNGQENKPSTLPEAQKMNAEEAIAAAVR